MRCYPSFESGRIGKAKRISRLPIYRMHISKCRGRGAHYSEGVCSSSWLLLPCLQLTYHSCIQSFRPTQRHSEMKNPGASHDNKSVSLELDSEGIGIKNYAHFLFPWTRTRSNSDRLARNAAGGAVLNGFIHHPCRVNHMTIISTCLSRTSSMNVVGTWLGDRSGPVFLRTT